MAVIIITVTVTIEDMEEEGAKFLATTIIIMLVVETFNRIWPVAFSPLQIRILVIIIIG
jgi:hypothetical protein